jgi:hypothetical protein
MDVVPLFRRTGESERPGLCGITVDMSLKSCLGLYSAIAAIICVNFIAAPSVWISLYGAIVDPQASLLFQLIGALFGGLAVMTEGERASANPRGTVVRGLIVTNGLAALVAAFGAVSGVYNQLAWGPVILFLAFAIGLAVSSRDRSGRLPVGRSLPRAEIALYPQGSASSLHSRSDVTRLAA